MQESRLLSFCVRVINDAVRQPRVTVAMPQIPASVDVRAVVTGNANNLPLMVIASMCDDPTSVGGKLGVACQQTGLAYVSFGSCAPLNALNAICVLTVLGSLGHTLFRCIWTNCMSADKLLF